MEQHMQISMHKSHNSSSKKAAMELYKEKEQLYLETDASDVLSRSTSSTSEGWNVVPKEQSTQKCSVAGNSICEQEPNKCINLLQQHRKRSPRHNVWPRTIPTIHHYCITPKRSVW